MSKSPGARGKAALDHERVPRRDEDLRNPCHLCIGDRLRNSHRHALVSDDKFSVARPRLNTHDSIAHRPLSDPRSDRLDNTCVLKTENFVLSFNGVWVGALALQRIGAIASAVRHRNANLVWARRRILNLFHHDGVRSSVLFYNCCSHLTSVACEAPLRQLFTTVSCQPRAWSPRLATGIQPAGSAAVQPHSL